MPRWLLFLVPPVYLACLFALQPADHLGPADAAPRLSLFLYDDYDMTALALRGLNHLEPRRPGRTDAPPKVSAEAFPQALADRSRALEPRYFLEYPHAVLWLTGFGFTGANPVTPPAVFDGCHNNVVEHVPGNAEEQDLWDRLRHATRVYRVLMTVALLLLIAVLLTDRTGPVLLLLLPGALFFAVNRFDVLPALLAACGFALLGRRWVVLSAVCLGAATMVKVYPVLLAPLVIRYLSENRRAAVNWTVAYASTLGAFLLPALIASDWEAVLGPYRYQLTRPPEFKWTLYGYVLPRYLGASDALGSAFRLGSVLVVLGLLLRRRPTDLDDLLRRGATVLLVFVALQVFYSPQWILWLLPLLVPLAERRRQLIPLLIALDLVSYFSLVSVLPGSPLWPALRVGLIVARAGLLAGLGWVIWQPLTEGSDQEGAGLHDFSASPTDAPYARAA